ncbi:MAG: L-ribulose-5-phosphate 4-epimerase AraD [Bryobacteraceae bacterium]|nr:L-ribulose-5-phosphate 4-epimerase AraD [Bryobacteraceae bacterium]
MQSLRIEVLEANLALVERGLVLYTFGNASGISREDGLVVIKPSGVSYASMTPDDLVVLDLNGQIVEGAMRPSSDTPTHLALYRAFPSIGGVVHTHSHFATCWAQACRDIPCFGTTHADYFYGSIPVTAHLDPSEIESEYEWNTGEAIIRRFETVDHTSIPAVLVAGHAPFCWGPSVTEAAQTAVILEEVARMAYHTIGINSDVLPLPRALLNKHFLRKHGDRAYYGQPRSTG